MKYVKILGMALGLLLALVLAAPIARADMSNQMTKLVFSQPVQIPGSKILPEGTYWFRMLSFQQPNTVMIYTANQTQVEASLETVPTYRTTKLGHAEISFAQAKSARQPATSIRWFYPAMQYGHQLVYSHQAENRINHEVVRNIIVQSTPVG
jgi:hypothetical protein